MNLELLLRQYLYLHKNVTYPGIGKLFFESGGHLPDAQEKGEATLLQGLAFNYNPLEGIDNDFIAFVSAQTGKIKPLAFADVESYFMLSKQFINIGKSFVVEGIGAIDKQDNGTLAFTPGYYVPVSEASATPHKPLKIRESQPIVPKTDNKPKPKPINKKAVGISLLVLALVLVGWGIYYLVTMFMHNSASKTANEDSTNKVIIKPVDTLPVSVKPQVTASAGFKAILDTKPTRFAAEARATKLKGFGHNAQVDSAGPANFRIYIPITDTSTAAIDALKLKQITGKLPKIVPAQ